MKKSTHLKITVSLGLFSLLLGTFGSHVLKNKLNLQELDWFKTGLNYQMFHVPCLLWLLSSNIRSWAWVSICWIAGIFLFSGSLYVLAISGYRTLGLITPLGGVSMMVGWALLLREIWRNPNVGIGNYCQS